MYKSILVPVDLSDMEKAKNCLRIAREIGGPDAELHLMHVVERVPIYVAAELPREIEENSVLGAQTALKELAETDPGNCRVHARLGHANRDIYVGAEELDVDLIIVGSHRPGLQDYLLGSTAARVVRHALCSVLVVR